MKILNWFTLIVFFIGFPALSWACPLCVNASPYKVGLLVAVGFLMLIPFGVTYLMYGWFQKASRTE